MRSMRADERPLWLVSELYYPEETSTGYLLTQIAEGLAGYMPVRAVCGQPTYSARGFRAPWREERAGVAIRRCWGTTWSKEVLPLRLVNLITISFSIFLHLLLVLRRGDQVLVVTNPPLLPFLVHFACRLRRARCLLLIHDVYPDVCVASGLLAPDSLLTRLIDQRVRRLYAAVEGIVVLGRDMHSLVQGKLARRHTPITQIPNWADVELVRPAPRDTNPLLTELGLVDKFVVQYAGNMGRSHDVEALVACAERLRDRPEIHFLMLGSGAKRAWLEQAVDARQLTNITLLAPRPRRDQPVFLNACDVAAITFVPGMAGISVPSRMYNALAAGKPILAMADSHSELACVVREEHVGWVVSPADVDALVDAIDEAYRSSAELVRMGHRARRAASKYTVASAIAGYARLLREPAAQKDAVQRAA